MNFPFNFPYYTSAQGRQRNKCNPRTTTAEGLTPTRAPETYF